MADPTTPNLIGDILEKLLPYFGTGLFGAAILALVNKVINRRRDAAEIDKTEAETEGIFATTYGNLNKTLSETNEKLSKALGETNEKLRTQTDLNLVLERSHLEKDRKYAEDLACEITKKLEALARHEESAILSQRTTLTTRRLFDKLGTPYWETDAKGNSIYINAAWLQMFGITAETQEKWIEAVIEADREKIIRQWRSQLSDTDTVTAIVFRVRQAEKVISVRSIYAIVRGKDGEPVKIIGVTVENK